MEDFDSDDVDPREFDMTDEEAAEIFAEQFAREMLAD